MGKTKKFAAIVVALGILFAVAASGCETKTAHVHEYGEWTVVKAATCGEDGIKEKICSCGEKTEEAMNIFAKTCKILRNYGERREKECSFRSMSSSRK